MLKNKPQADLKVKNRTRFFVFAFLLFTFAFHSQCGASA